MKIIKINLSDIEKIKKENDHKLSNLMNQFEEFKKETNNDKEYAYKISRESLKAKDIIITKITKEKNDEQHLNIKIKKEITFLTQKSTKDQNMVNEYSEMLKIKDIELKSLKSQINNDGKDFLKEKDKLSEN